jgi:hypothetical protein
VSGQWSGPSGKALTPDTEDDRPRHLERGLAHAHGLGDGRAGIPVARPYAWAGTDTLPTPERDWLGERLAAPGQHCPDRGEPACGLPGSLLHPCPHNQALGNGAYRCTCCLPCESGCPGPHRARRPAASGDDFDTAGLEAEAGQ